MVRVAEEHRHRQRRGNRAVVGHLQAAVPCQDAAGAPEGHPSARSTRGRPRRLCAHRAARRPSRNGWRDPPGLPPLTSASRTPGHPPKTVAGPGEPGIGLDGTLPDRDGVADLATAVGGPLAQRSPYRTITAQMLKHADVECLPRRHIHITVDGFVRDPHVSVTRMLPPQPLGDLLWRLIVIKFGGDQARQPPIRGQLAHLRTPRPPERSSIGSQRPIRVATTIADDLPWTPSTTAGRYDRRSFALSDLLRSHVRFLHARPRPDDWPCAAAEREESHPTDAKTAESEATSRPACAPFPGSNHHGAT